MWLIMMFLVSNLDLIIAVALFLAPFVYTWPVTGT